MQRCHRFKPLGTPKPIVVHSDEQGNPVHAQVLVDEPPDGEREHHPQHDEGVLVLEAELGMRPVRVVLVHLFAVLLHGGHGLGQADHCRPCDEQDDVGLVGRHRSIDVGGRNK